MVSAIVGGVIALVTLVIGVVIVDSVIAAQKSWNSTLVTTVITYLPVLMILGGLALAGGLAYAYFQ